MKALVTASLLLPASLLLACSSSRDEGASLDPSTDPDVSVAVGAEGSGVHVNAVTEAPTGFDNRTNGFSAQTAMDEAAA